MMKIIAFTILVVFPVFSFEMKPSGFVNLDPLEKDEVKARSYSVDGLWDNIRQKHPLLKKEVLSMAYKGYLKMIDDGLIEEGRPLTIVDFDLPSSDQRLWVIDVDNQDLEYASLVAHGRNSGELHASKFSNVPESYMSSLGFYLTGETYFGKHGKSLRLDGMEEGINDNARARAIVMHAAAYAEKSFVKRHGRLGRSLGCPALPSDNFEAIIDLIKEKSCLFVHASEPQYRSQSVYIKGKDLS
ncbi:murein L,D-transpeptidase catalytic domain family protein [Cyclobacterium sp. 1_MG-2023]|uniref:murein L,D-transpeptidase catalytic domain family protein n=1 Tax=Cyclobacterium sp. 1_MG-2023 TaxID=3062681 RepID=UPI0026E168F7|nr:murein L,D-transpeptidase catalytic domain family protein [Cyclobacterium sp. 1_MG-2023]MDO6437578.1 murein L,D-transpeptidase catalytic domain family protein [Cyclobacterium sp. 1_MG-2023]